MFRACLLCTSVHKARDCFHKGLMKIGNIVRIQKLSRSQVNPNCMHCKYTLSTLIPAISATAIAWPKNRACENYLHFFLWDFIFNFLFSQKTRLTERYSQSRLKAQDWKKEIVIPVSKVEKGFSSASAKGSHQSKKVTKLRTLSVPPLAPASTDTYGGLFSKSAYRRLATFGEKARMLPFLEGTYPFH